MFDGLLLDKTDCVVPGILLSSNKLGIAQACVCNGRLTCFHKHQNIKYQQELNVWFSQQTNLQYIHNEQRMADACWFLSKKCLSVLLYYKDTGTYFSVSYHRVMASEFTSQL